MLGCVAGLLLALDGLELVLSRTAILDIFVMFWVLAAFGLLVIDRDRTRARLKAAAGSRAARHRRAEARHPLAAGRGRAVPGRGVRDQVERRVVPPRLRRPRGCLGYGRAPGGRLRQLAAGRPAQRRASGCRPGSSWRRPSSTWRRGAAGSPPATATTGTGQRSTATTRRSGRPSTPGTSTTTGCCSFGLGLTSRPAYKSNPLGWLVLARPISFYWCAGGSRCGGSAPATAQEVLAIGTPLIWWGGALALLFCLAWWLTGLVGDTVFGRMPRRDWRAGAVLLGVAAGWLPWIWLRPGTTTAPSSTTTRSRSIHSWSSPSRCASGLIVGPARAAPGRRALGAVAAGAYLVAGYWSTSPTCIPS